MEASESLDEAEAKRTVKTAGRAGVGLRQPSAFFLGFALGLGFSSVALAASQTFNTALPVAKDQFIFRAQFVATRATGDSSLAGRKLNVFGGVSVLGYGVTGDLAVFGLLPYLDKDLEVTTPIGQRVTRHASGIGDAQLFGRYTIYRDDAPGRTLRIAPFLGVKLPTGNDDDRDTLGTLPAPLQLGSGSWDPLGGGILTYQTLQYQIDAQASYKLNTEANNFRFGDESRLDASFQYRLWPRHLNRGVPGFVCAVLEGNLIHQGENRLNGFKDPNSGGTSFFLSPGIQYITKRWVFEGIVQVPVFQNLNGASLKDDFTVRAGFRLNF